ncbi:MULTISPECIES: 2-amino-4-hydroxy-6-hydroxymethyldihydropteridine diphosphokinase [unclassified Saccharicrinis]|uniref:2-amino-4-hydroxy-6- hydroxymethyldihydropteridine diphosphokinase n=1 Tax=unclassified Saccharicrinis TaxID=2646859 RepID=UPI003D333520
MHKAILLIGGNEGDRLGIIQEARNLIRDKIGTIVKASSNYESEPWGFKHHQNFINQVIEVFTPLSPNEVLFQGQVIEKQLGRRTKTQVGYEARTMDIDILFYDDLIIESLELAIPHPKLQDRMFTVLPLIEEWGNHIHPVLNKPLKQLLEECDDDGWVKKLE